MSERTPESLARACFSYTEIYSKVLMTDFYTYSEHTPMRRC
jgi:hypothetical protein